MLSVRRDLIGAAAVMIAAFVLSRLTGLLRTIAVSYQFGTGPELNAYVAAMRIPDLIFQVVAGGAVASAFIPVLAAYLARDDADGAWRLVSGLMTLALAVMAPLCLLIAIFAEPAMRIVAPQFPDAQRALAADLVRIVVISPPLFALGTLMTSVLQAHQRFLLTALAPSLYNLGIIGGALGLAPSLGIHGLAVGAALGAASFTLVQVPGVLRSGMRYRPTLGLADPGVRQVALLMAPRTLGLAVIQINFVVVVALASGIPGAITALDYAFTLMMLPLGVFAMAISTAVFPTLADLTARDQIDEMVRTLTGALRVILYLTIPASAGLIVLAEPIVRLVLERGQFTPESTALTVIALRFYALGLAGQATLEIVTRAFYALQDTRTPVAVAFAGMFLNLVLAYLMRETLGHGGLALAVSLAALFESGLLLLLARRRLGGLREGEVARSAARAIVGAAVLAGALVPLSGLLAPLGRMRGLGEVAEVGGAIAAGGAIYLATTVILRSDEPGRLLVLARRRVG